MSEINTTDTSAVDETSQEYLGRWNRLVSTTNWEKGRIVHEWRAALVAADAPIAEYSDESWSSRASQVTPQHVGRLRRTYERFGKEFTDYDGLFWSHFAAAIDWDDAEMWLEGAVQNAWSVSAMRKQRWEAIGAPADQKPSDSDIIVTELDEGALPPGSTFDTVRNPGNEEHFEADFGDESADSAQRSTAPEDATDSHSESVAPEDRIAPFANLAELPPDVTDAFEKFKLAILNHKLAAWQHVSREDIVATLESLKQLALADAASE